MPIDQDLLLAQGETTNQIPYQLSRFLAGHGYVMFRSFPLLLLGMGRQAWNILERLVLQVLG